MRKLFLLIVGFMGQSLLAQDFKLYRVPDEVETTGDHANGLSNGGSAAVSGLSSIRLNPAMLAMEKAYKVSGSYHWPSSGREFYNAGIIDGTTADDVAAGVAYTSFMDPFELDWAKRDRHNQAFDSPVVRRLAGGFAQNLNRIAYGVNAQFVEGYEQDEDEAGIEAGYERIKGTSFGLGLAGLLTPGLRFGLSAENIANSQIKNFAPTTYRGGLAYLLGEGRLSLHADYSHRERVLQELDTEDRKAEQMAIGSMTVQVYELVRLLGAYSHELGGDRASLSGGVALVNRSFSLSYTGRRPYIGNSEVHQSINFSMAVTM